MDETRIERALREGPPFATQYLDQRLPAWSAAPPRPMTWLLFGVALLLALAVGGAVLIGSGLIHATRERVWTVTGSMVEPRVGHTATLLPDGRVLAVGGGQFNGRFDLASAELYDPRTGSWTSTVLVAGGQPDGGGSESWASAVLYDPATGTWKQTASMVVARTSHTATLLPNGQVLVSGGYNNDGILSSSELYDPDLGTWTAAGDMGLARVGHAAALLPDGHVLVAGGGNQATS